MGDWMRTPIVARNGHVYFKERHANVPMCEWSTFADYRAYQQDLLRAYFSGADRTAPRNTTCLMCLGSGWVT